MSRIPASASDLEVVVASAARRHTVQAQRGRRGIAARTRNDAASTSSGTSEPIGRDEDATDEGAGDPERARVTLWRSPIAPDSWDSATRVGTKRLPGRHRDSRAAGEQCEQRHEQGRRRVGERDAQGGLGQGGRDEDWSCPDAIDEQAAKGASRRRGSAPAIRIAATPKWPSSCLARKANVRRATSSPRKEIPGRGRPRHGAGHPGRRVGPRRERHVAKYTLHIWSVKG